MKDLREEEADAIQRALCDQKLSETNMKKTDKAVEIDKMSNTKNMGGLIQSFGALVGAAAPTVADKQKLLTLVQAQQASNSDKEDMDLAAPAAL